MIIKKQGCVLAKLVLVLFLLARGESFPQNYGSSPSQTDSEKTGKIHSRNSKVTNDIFNSRIPTISTTTNGRDSLGNVNSEQVDDSSPTEKNTTTERPTDTETQQEKQQQKPLQQKQQQQQQRQQLQQPSQQNLKTTFAVEKKSGSSRVFIFFKIAGYLFLLAIIVMCLFCYHHHQK